MCGRFSQTAEAKELQRRFGFQDAAIELSPRYNLAPGQSAPTVINPGSRILNLMQWGLVPSWAKEAAIGNKMINARAETIAEKPSYRKSFERRRCLVLADGFFEWRMVEGIKRKIPMRITLKNREPFALAGLWDIWKKPDGGEIRSFTIITTQPNDFMKPIHNLICTNKVKFLSSIFYPV
ncbi:MAG: SOS response-associated peptidase [Elusimicrobia bacterium]|nr:SOS response-associated peptidase [Elusimicrobiota bacterium]